MSESYNTLKSWAFSFFFFELDPMLLLLVQINGQVSLFQKCFERLVGVAPGSSSAVAWPGPLNALVLFNHPTHLQQCYLAITTSLSIHCSPTVRSITTIKTQLFRI